MPIQEPVHPINRDSYEHTFWNQTPEIFQDRREPYRATSVPFPTAEQALRNLQAPIPERDFRKDSDFVVNLDARAEEKVWQFHWAYSCENKAIQTTPKADPAAFTGTQYGENLRWDYITVPMSWQTAEVFDEETGLYRRLYDSPMYIGDGVIFENYEKSRDARTLRVDPDTASVGTYRRRFDIPDAWEGRESYICFNGVGTEFYVWVNGVYCGFGENRTAISAFNITDAIKNGETNEVVVEVYRNGCGIYMEDQDMTRFSGIFRDVYCYSVSKSLSIRDFRAIPSFDAEYRDAALSVKVYLHSYDGSQLSNATVTTALYDGDVLVSEKTFSAQDAEVVTNEELTAKGDYTEFVRDYETELVLRTALEVPTPKHWTDETPYLYNLVLTVSNGQTVTEATGCKVGFRVLELMTAENGKQYYAVNGQRILLYGANRHEMWLDTGAWVSAERHAQELAQMKALNINSIRTSHYNCDPALYDYCDEYGIYLFAEANVETASDIEDPDAPINRGPSDDDFADGKSGPEDIVGPEPTDEEKESAIAKRLGFLEASEMQLRLEPALLDRQKTNVIPNKNHPSVIIWSVCNEAGSGSPYLHMHQWIQNYEEETRIIFYKAEYEGNTVSNLDYPSPTAVIQYCEGKDPRPLVMSEYAYGEVQSRGGLSDSYVFVNDLAKDYVNFLGMYTWSWKDQSFYAYGADTHVEEPLKRAGMQRYLGYQGMWMDKLYGAQIGHFALGAFACTGTVTGSNEYKPEAVDLKAAYSRARVEAADLSEGRLLVTNRFSFRNLSDFELVWTLTDGENCLASGIETVDLPAAQTFQGTSVEFNTKEITIPALAKAVCSAPEIPGTELFVNVSFRYKEDPVWAAVERSMVHGTVEGDTPYDGVVRIDPSCPFADQLPVRAFPAPQMTETGKILIAESAVQIEITAGDMVWQMDKARGVLVRGTYRGAELLAEPLLPEYDAIINEQLGPNMGACSKTDWQQAVAGMRVQKLDVRAVSDGLLLIDVKIALDTASESTLHVIYSFYGDGRVFLNTTVSFADGLGTVPAVAWSLQMPENFQNVKYLGAGPDETYMDRRHGALVGAYETTPETMAYPYLYPCENGNRTECRWMTVTDGSCGLLFTAGEGPMQCSVLHHTADQLRSKKKWSRSYMELRLPEYRTENAVVRIAQDVTGTGMGLATDYVSHTIASGEVYTFSFGICPLEMSAVYPALSDVAGLLRSNPLPERLFAGLAIDGQPVARFRPGMEEFTIDVVRADYESEGTAALPQAELYVPGAVTLTRQEEPVSGDVVQQITYTAACHGAEETVTLRWVLADEKYLSTMAVDASEPTLVCVDRSMSGAPLKSVKAVGRGPTYRVTETSHERGVSLSVGQTASAVEVRLDVSGYTKKGYQRLTGLCGVAPGQKRLNTHGFNIDFEIADLCYTIVADDKPIAEGVCAMGQDSVALDLELGAAKYLTLRAALPKEGYYMDTAFDFCDLKLSK